MTSADIRKLVAGYASGTLSEAERKVLFEAALRDQALFDALADEEPLRELLSDAEVRGELLETLDESQTPPSPHAVDPSLGKRMLQIQREVSAQPTPVPLPPDALPAGVRSVEAPKQAPTDLPPRPRPSTWWRLPVYGSLAAALAVAVGLFITSNVERRQQIALSRPAATAVPPPASPPQVAPEPIETDRPLPAAPRQPSQSVPVAERRKDAPVSSAELSKRAAPRGPVQADVSFGAAPQQAAQPEQFRAESVPPQSPKPMIAAAPPPPPPSAPSTSATPPSPTAAAPAGAAALKTAETATTFTSAGPFRYRVEQLGPNTRWVPAPAPLHAGTELRLLFAASQAGTVVASLPDNRTEILHVIANQWVTLPLPASPGMLRIGLSLQSPQADMTPRAKRLSRARSAGAASSSSEPSSDVEIHLEILP